MWRSAAALGVSFMLRLIQRLLLIFTDRARTEHNLCGYARSSPCNVCCGSLSFLFLAKWEHCTFRNVNHSTIIARRFTQRVFSFSLALRTDIVRVSVIRNEAGNFSLNTCTAITHSFPYEFLGCAMFHTTASFCNIYSWSWSLQLSCEW